MDIDKILSRLGVDQLNPMQLEVARLMSLTTDDITILSPTGSGKTLAYMLPVVFKMNPNLDMVQAAVKAVIRSI